MKSSQENPFSKSRHGHIDDRRMKWRIGDVARIKPSSIKRYSLPSDTRLGEVTRIQFDQGSGLRGEWLINVRLASSGEIYTLGPTDLVFEHEGISNPLRPRLTPYTGRKLPRANPGAQWHEDEIARLHRYGQARPGMSTDSYAWLLGEISGHKNSIKASEKLGLPNPLAYGPTGFRPPRAWFRKMMENVARGYRKPSAMTKAEFTRAISRIVGGIWSRFSDSTRRAIVRKYEGG